ncbi:glycine-rich cell wall structural protein 1-like [Schistocerca piceifrons]|uniref:glycine-rich cell wall structural protein 1-like n=1 Tax=Schistocerca piceifrons TaxID=274613 RepID=UPI001F5F3ED6|nr:glycine-rich cell wall structural protein 1-like [Schistocerca piceifrons]
MGKWVGGLVGVGETALPGPENIGCSNGCGGGGIGTFGCLPPVIIGSSDGVVGSSNGFGGDGGGGLDGRGGGGGGGGGGGADGEGSKGCSWNGCGGGGTGTLGCFPPGTTVGGENTLPVGGETGNSNGFGAGGGVGMGTGADWIVGGGETALPGTGNNGSSNGCGGDGIFLAPVILGGSDGGLGSSNGFGGDGSGGLDGLREGLESGGKGKGGGGGGGGGGRSVGVDGSGGGGGGGDREGGRSGDGWGIGKGFGTVLTPGFGRTGAGNCGCAVGIGGGLPTPGLALGRSWVVARAPQRCHEWAALLGRQARGQRPEVCPAPGQEARIPATVSLASYHPAPTVTRTIPVYVPASTVM